MPRIVFLIFLVAIVIRFLYFPENVYFGFDQARDSFTSLEVLKGDFKIIGPPTTAGSNIFHGALIYYILAPIYFLSNNNPEAAAAVFRVINALGVFLVFYIGSLVFSKKIGAVAALLFAISYEQNQYSLFFGHPSLGVFTILIYYSGLALLIFQNNPLGFIIALLGLGLTIQFEDANLTLFLVSIIYLLFFFKKIKLLNFKTVSAGFLVFVATLSTFILSEIKYNFRMTNAILDIHSNIYPEHLISVTARLIHDNFLANQALVPFILLALMVAMRLLIKGKKAQQAIFLMIWFLGGMIAHVLNSSFTYYYSPGASVSLLILVSFLIYQIFLRSKLLAAIPFILIIFSNFSLITGQNYLGPNKDIIIQPGLLTSSERQSLDYIYQKADGQPFAVNALTVPLNVKTTWDYLFNWYGKWKYGYLPVWGREAADGFPGTLPVATDRSKLPHRRFTIIEPTVGINTSQVDDFFRVENYFSKVVDEKHFGTITVQERQKI